MTIQTINFYGYRITMHSDGSVTVHIIMLDGNEASYHVADINEAQSALGY